MKIDYNYYNQYYFNLTTQFEMRKVMWNREFAMLSDGMMIRHMRFHRVQDFQFWRKYLWGRFKSKPFNFYYSLARYDNGVPPVKWYEETWEERKQDWAKKYIKEMVSYDFLIDVDSPTHEKEDMEMAHYSTKIIKEHLDKHKVAYELRFSGMGYHIIIPYRYLPKLSMNPADDVNIYKYLTRILKSLSSNFSEFVDTGICDSRRVTKIPYSLACYNTKELLFDAYMCFPFLDSESFLKFKYDDAEPEFWINTWQNIMKDRGYNVFNIDSSMENFKNFAHSLGVYETDNP